MMLHQVLENQRLILQKLNREEEQDYSEMVDALRSPSNSKFELHRLEDTHPRQARPPPPLHRQVYICVSGVSVYCVQYWRICRV